MIDVAATPIGLDDQEAAQINAWWRAANYLAVGQIYLIENPLLREPLRKEHLKPRLVGHWGTTPGLNFIYAHLNRLITRHHADVLFVAGPGHGGPAVVASTYLEGTYSELYPEVTRDEAGIGRLMKRFSFPGGVGSHATPETPGSIHEGGELGYSLAHAYGAAFDDPDLIVACVIGDGEAETGPLATGWHGNKFLSAARDGAVLPILHLNGYKIASPTILARMPRAELDALLRGCGYEPVYVEGNDPLPMHHAMAETLEATYAKIRAIQRAAREDGVTHRPQWPMIVLVTPKGWTGPKMVDGRPMEGTARAHQVPLTDFANHPDYLGLLEAWMQSYRPRELFDERGTVMPEITALAPRGDKRMGSGSRANGGRRLTDLAMPDFRSYAVTIREPGRGIAESTRVLGAFIRDIMHANPQTFRLFGPDETASNRLDDVFEQTPRMWTEPIIATDPHLGNTGRVMEVLSEHQCEGWLEGYLLTGRHGLFSCYEAFIHIVDSMVNQHAKWLKVAHEVSWRKPIASLNILLTSHVWRQDHNGFSHQDPGFLDHVVNKKAETVRVYLPPDANTLLSVVDHCLRSRNFINVIVAGKQPELQYLDMDAAIEHCRVGMSEWRWASTHDDGLAPDVVMACAGDVPTLETLAAIEIIHTHLPDVRIRMVNVVDLMSLESPDQHPHGLAEADFDALFTTNRPVVFAFHGYPWLIHRLTYKRTNHQQFHVRGYIEEGTTTTPFDMCVRNRIDRYHLALDVIARVPGLAERGEALAATLREALADHTRYVNEIGDDRPEIRNWKWNAGSVV